MYTYASHRLISTMGFPMVVRRHFDTESRHFLLLIEEKPIDITTLIGIDIDSGDGHEKHW